MATFKDLEDSLKSFMIQEQSDAHNVRTANVAKYNNIKMWVDMAKYQQPHFFVRISISEAAFTINDCTKLSGGLGYEERFVYKWFGRIGNKDKLSEVWKTAQLERQDSADNSESEQKEN